MRVLASLKIKLFPSFMTTEYQQLWIDMCTLKVSIFVIYLLKNRFVSFELFNSLFFLSRHNIFYLLKSEYSLFQDDTIKCSRSEHDDEVESQVKIPLEDADEELKEGK